MAFKTTDYSSVIMLRKVFFDLKVFHVIGINESHVSPWLESILRNKSNNLIYNFWLISKQFSSYVIEKQQI